MSLLVRQFGHYTLTMLQFLPFTMCFLIQIQSSMTIFHSTNVRMQNIPNFISIIGMEVIQISIIHFNHKKSYQSHIKYHTTPWLLNIPHNISCRPFQNLTLSPMKESKNQRPDHLKNLKPKSFVSTSSSIWRPMWPIYIQM